MGLSKYKVKVGYMTSNIIMTIPILIISAVFTFLSSILLIKIEKNRGILCKDVHKPYEYYLPCIGGFPLYIGNLTGILLLMYFKFLDLRLGISIILVMTCGLLIGFFDDINGLRSRWKILLGLTPAIPLILMGCYTPRPWIPFIGHARLHILYPLLLLVSSTVYLNGANMIDTHNGLLPMFAFALSFFVLILKIVTIHSIEDVILASLFIATLFVYLLFNMYPAKLFNGNTGAFLIGSILFLIVAVFRVEFYVIIASIPMFLNGFYYISSVKGFLQKEQVSRPTIVDGHGCIHPSRKIHPITFIKLTLLISGKPFSEKELVEILYLVYITTASISFTICYILGYN